MPMRRTISAVSSLALVFHQCGSAFAQLEPGANGAGRPVAGETRFFHTDSSSSTVVVTDLNGHETARLVRTPYGVLEINSSSGTDDFRPKFEGKELDRLGSTTDTPFRVATLQAFPARPYSPGLAMFVAPDPAGQFSNPYGFVGGNPVTLVDPTGMLAEESVVLSQQSTQASTIAYGSVEGSIASESIATDSALSASLLSTDATVLSGSAASGPALPAILGALALANLGVILATAFSGTGGSAPPASTGGTFQHPAVPGTWTAGGSPRIASSMEPLDLAFAGPPGILSLISVPLADSTFLPYPPSELGKGILDLEDLYALSIPLNLSAMTLASGDRSAAKSELCPVVEETGSSFPAGTAVTTERGERPIESIGVGDRVLSRDQADGTSILSQVGGTVSRVAYDLVRIELSDGTRLSATPAHRLLTSDGWIQAQDLKAGMTVTTTHRRGHVEVRSVKRDGAPTRVFNLEVKGAHNFAVTRSEVIVHNDGFFDSIVESIASEIWQPNIISEHARLCPSGLADPWSDFRRGTHEPAVLPWRFSKPQAPRPPMRADPISPLFKGLNYCTGGCFGRKY